MDLVNSARAAREKVARETVRRQAFAWDGSDAPAARLVEVLKKAVEAGEMTALDALGTINRARFMRPHEIEELLKDFGA